MVSLKSQFKNVKKILVFNPSFIGDSILTTPLINALQKLLPNAEVVFCVRPESAPVLKNIRTVVYDKRGKASGFKGMFAFAQEIKEGGYDLILSLHKSIRSTILIKLSGIPAYGFKQSALAFLYNGTVVRDKSIHEVERNLAMLSVICDGYTKEWGKELGGGLSTYLDAEFYNSIKVTLAIGSPVIGVNAGSVWATKRWPAEKFAAFCTLLYRSTDATIILMGGPGDVEVNDKLKQLLHADGTPFYDYVNKVSFDKIPAVIKCCDIMVTNDSAPLHIAVSQQVPVVAIFGSTVPAQGFYPYDSKSIVCEADLDCRPCGAHGSNSCPIKTFDCMKKVEAATVYDSVMKLLSRGKSL